MIGTKDKLSKVNVLRSNCEDSLFSSPDAEEEGLLHDKRSDLVVVSLHPRDLSYGRLEVNLFYLLFLKIAPSATRIFGCYDDDLANLEGFLEKKEASNSIWDFFKLFLTFLLASG